MLTWLSQHLQHLRLGKRNPPVIPDALWLSTLQAYPFLTADPANDPEQLRAMVAQFLAEKEFDGAHGLPISDAMAVAIAAQACLPVLHLGLHWYDDFKGIVVHPGAMLARREVVDDAGVVHEIEYLAAIGTDYAAVMTARAVVLAAQLQEAEADALLNNGA